MSTNKQALKENALAATAGSWVRESGEGWEAICCDDDQGNAGFIIAEFQGKDAAANRKFVESANPAAVLSLLDELEGEAGRIKELESQRKLAFTAGNRWAEKFREAENRNAEQASIIAKQEKWIKDVEVTMISATDRAEAAEKRIAELSESHSKLRETMAAIHNTIKQDGFATPLAVIMQNAKRAHEESAAAGITVKGDSE